MSTEMKKEIDKLRMIRSKSKKGMGKSKSTMVLKKKESGSSSKSQSSKDEQRLKDVFAERQREKLSRI